MADRPFKTLFESHGYNVRVDAVFEIGEGWEHNIRQASAALLGFPTKVWIKGGHREDGALVLDLDFENEADAETSTGVRHLLQLVKTRSLKECEVCGYAAQLRYDDPLQRTLCDEHAAER